MSNPRDSLGGACSFRRSDGLATGRPGPKGDARCVEARFVYPRESRVPRNPRPLILTRTLYVVADRSCFLAIEAVS